MEITEMEIIKNLIKLDDNSLYNWLVNNISLDLYKYCMLLKFMKENLSKKSYINQYLSTNKICRHYSNFITKRMIEFYKGKYHSLGTIYIVVDLYYGEQCGVRGMNYEFDENITKDGIKYILAVRHFNHKIEKDVQFVKFLNKSKKLGYSREKFILRTGVSKDFYDKVDDNYCQYITQPTYQQFLENLKFNNDALACMEFIKALQNSAVDTDNGDIIVSIEAVNSIITGADIDKHLNEN